MITSLIAVCKREHIQRGLFLGHGYLLLLFCKPAWARGSFLPHSTPWGAPFSGIHRNDLRLLPGVSGMVIYISLIMTPLGLHTFRVG